MGVARIFVSIARLSAALYGIRARATALRIPLFPPQRAVILLLFFCGGKRGIRQSVASRAACLHVAVVCCRKSLSLFDDCL